MARTARLSRIGLVGISVLALSACADRLGDFDFDLRDLGGSQADTSGAAGGAAARPTPDARGVISYPDYQVAVAQDGDTVATMAARLGVPAAELARFNGLAPNENLRAGELVSLPTRVADSAAGPGAISSEPISPGGVDIAAVAGGAIDRSEQTGGNAAQQPIRHRVQAGETAFTIARRYEVSVEALAAWNGLDNDYTVRNDQFLLIPPVAFAAPSPSTAATAPAGTQATTTRPGQGSPTPTPPSAATPLPAVTPSPEPAPAPEPETMADDQTSASGSAFGMPVNGSIVRDYDGDDFTGIGIAASPGDPVMAAADGTVVLITRDTNQNAILVLRHADGVMTVYSGIDGITVERGDSVSRGQRVAVIKDESTSLFFQVRKGNETFDPMSYLQ